MESSSNLTLSQLASLVAVSRPDIHFTPQWNGCALFIMDVSVISPAGGPALLGGWTRQLALERSKCTGPTQRNAALRHGLYVCGAECVVC